MLAGWLQPAEEHTHHPIGTYIHASCCCLKCFLNVEYSSSNGSFLIKTRRNRRQRPAAKLIGPNCNGNPWPIKLSMAMLKTSIAQQQQQEDINGTKTPQRRR